LIPQSFIQELLARVDIVDVVERYVKLKKAGANYVACCPFHSEKTPSFSVSPSKQFYHCFGCGAHGSAISFVMQYTGMGFPDAVRELASAAGMVVPEQRSAGPRQDKEHGASLAEIMARAARFYRDQLKAGAVAVDYLKRRGLTGEIAARFGIGYAPAGWQNLDQVFADYRAPELLECGLVIENEQGRRYDRFRDRVMFPILDGRGQVIGFGGRILAAGEPKYLNSPETPLFDKGRELYGLFQAAAAIRASGAAIVVEGYMDVVALAQYGIANAVATLGTATTSHHVHKLLRLADRVVFCFDGDAAGRKAAWRALEASLEQLADNKAAAFMFLPPEHDPDSFVRECGRDEFDRLAGRALPLSEFMLRHLKSDVDLTSAEGRSRIVHEAKGLLARVSAPVLRLQMVRGVAEAARISPSEVEALCGLKPLVRQSAASRPLARRGPPPLSRTLLKIALQKPGWAPSLPVESVPADREGDLLSRLCTAVDHGELPAADLGTVLEFFRGSADEPLLNEVVAEITDESLDEEAMEAVFNDAVDRLRRAGLAEEIKILTAKERASGLSAEERLRLTQLLVQKQGIASPAAEPGLR
jgi:DNA primase